MTLSFKELLKSHPIYATYFLFEVVCFPSKYVYQNLYVYSHLCESEFVQACPTLCNPMGCSLLGSYIHGIFQTRILTWVTISFSRRSSQPRV